MRPKLITVILDALVLACRQHGYKVQYEWEHNTNRETDELTLTAIKIGK